MQTLTRQTTASSCGHPAGSRIEIPVGAGHRTLCCRCAQKEIAKALRFRWQAGEPMR